MPNQQPVQQQYQPLSNKKSASNPGLIIAVASLVAGFISLLGLVLGLTDGSHIILYLPYTAGIFAIIFCAVGKTKGCSNSITTIGITLGIISVAVYIVLIMRVNSEINSTMSELLQI